MDHIKSTELSIDILGLSSPIAAATPADLMISPRNQAQLTQINLDSLDLELNLAKNELTTENEKKTDEDNESIKTFTLKENEKSENKEESSEIHNEDNEEDEAEDDDDDDDEDENNNVDVMSNQMSPISQGSPISISSYSPNPYAALSMLASDRSLLSLEKLEEQVKQKIHSRKFREYCNQIINGDIDAICSSLLHEIVRFQDRLYHKNPAKAKMKRRYVMGIREVTKHLKLQKLKCVILAPNCEKIQSKGGLDDAINLIIQTSIEQNVPFVFALGRKGLGKAVNKLVPISVVGIFDYSGAEEFFRRLVELANNAKLAYQEMVEEYEKEECEHLIVMHKQLAASEDSMTMKGELVPTPSVQYQPKLPSHMAHSRTPSNGSNISIEPYFMNYHTHSRSASGTFNYGHTTSGGGAVGGHSRSASGGGGGTLNIDLGLHGAGKHWTHSRTPSNCSNISFISRLSEPISEVGGSVGTLFMGSTNNSTNNLAYFVGGNASSNPASNTLNSAFAAVQYYTEQVRQEMRESESLSANNQPLGKEQSASELEAVKQEAGQSGNASASQSVNAVSSSLVNLHLGCINEIDAGNEADTEEHELIRGKAKLKTIKSKQSSIDNENNGQAIDKSDETSSSENKEKQVDSPESKQIQDKNE
jgi:selenocysteine insertion sequence-binding protein 2